MKTQTALLNLVTLVAAFSLFAQGARATAQEEHPERFAFGEKVLKTTDFMGPVGNAQERLRLLVAKSIGHHVQPDARRPLDQFSTTTLPNGEAILAFTHQGEFIQDETGAYPFQGELKEDFVFSTSIILGSTLERSVGFIMFASQRLPSNEELLKYAELDHVNLTRLGFNVLIPKGTRFRVLAQETSDGTFVINNIDFMYSVTQPIWMERAGATPWKAPQYSIQ